MSPTKTIFVIDDEAVVRGLMRAALEGRGYRVEEFQTGEAALKRMTEEPNAVCLDIMLKGESGLDVLKKMHERSETTPVIMVTA
ncbi:MAG: response regulator, partial [Myxococcales bacterium]|nr:response regulator [Myxococcales bacterium]